MQLQHRKKTGPFSEATTPCLQDHLQLLAVASVFHGINLHPHIMKNQNFQACLIREGNWILHENRPDLYIWHVPVLIKHMSFTIIENIQGWLVSSIFFPWNCFTKYQMSRWLNHGYNHFFLLISWLNTQGKKNYLGNM